MNAVDVTFARLHAEGRKALIPFLTAGDPSLAATGQLFDEVVRQGADLVEIGFPYSDPIADGPVIQSSYVRALSRGLTVAQVLAAAREWHVRTPHVPLLAMLSYSLVHRHGPGDFVAAAQAAGFSGAIVPDLPCDEAEELANLARAADFKLIQLATPTTPPARAAAIARQSTGFLYCVSVTGITGARVELPKELSDRLNWLRSQTNLPLCVGFGVSRPEHARVLRGVADGVIVGSALVRLVEEASPGDAATAIQHVGELVHSLRQALDGNEAADS